MILFLTLIYVGFIYGLSKLGVITITPFWKFSPVLWILFLLIALFIPMQWGAPAGGVTMYQVTQEVFPNVTGKVIEVPCEPFVQMKKGDVLYKIDPTVFEAKVADLKAQLKLAELRLSQSATLVKASAGSKYEFESNEAQVESLKAALTTALWELEETTVKAPADGKVVAVTLRPGQRVTNVPVRSFLSFVTDEQIGLFMSVHQNQLRFIEKGQEVEVSLKVFPGKVLSGKVKDIAYTNSNSQIQPSGIIPTIPFSPAPLPFGVLIELDNGQLDDTALRHIPGGSIGTSAIYTEQAGFTHVIRKVMLRMDAWINYVNPF